MRYLRAQGLHENERFSDVACLFLPGAAVVLFLATHLLQSGSRERCEEEEEERGDCCGRCSHEERDYPGASWVQDAKWSLLGRRSRTSQACEILCCFHYSQILELPMSLPLRPAPATGAGRPRIGWEGAGDHVATPSCPYTRLARGGNYTCLYCASYFVVKKPPLKGC